MLKYFDYATVFQEIPDEINLAIDITNCPNNCKGCHSPYLRDDIGVELSFTELDKMISKSRGISCVLFMGGDNDHRGIQILAEYIKNKYNLRVGIYSGMDKIDEKLLPYLDYYKVGHYDENCGGLKDKKTNQKLYKVSGDNLIDITYRFWR